MVDGFSTKTFGMPFTEILVFVYPQTPFLLKHYENYFLNLSFIYVLHTFPRNMGLTTEWQTTLYAPLSASSPRGQR